MNNTKYGKLTAGLIAAWFIFAVAAAAAHLFENAYGRLALPVALAATTPILIFLLWFATSAGFRQFLLSLDPRALTLVHSWRTVGFTFVALTTYGLLPALFAMPAGWGDIAIGLTAPLVAMRLARPEHKSAFVVWQVLGILDLVAAVVLGTTARLISPASTSMAAMTALPLSLIPTFGVPLLMILHIISIAQARKWHSESAETYAAQLA